MRCRCCNNDVGTGEWKYCPFCGENITSKPIYKIGMQDLSEKILNGLQKRLMKKLLATLANSPDHEKNSGIGGFSVKISSRHGIAPQTTKQATCTRKKTVLNTTKKRPAPKEITEPETSIKRFPDKLKADICLPGIENMDDIDILELDNSCEIRAYCGNRLYFKIIQIPQHLSLSSRNLDNEMLVLEFTH